MATVNPTPAQPKTSTTAEDTLQRKSRDASVISGGHLVAKALKNEGVDTIFTLCGGHIIDIYDGCVDEGIRIIDVRHEQVAAHAADGYARQTGKLGCVVTTAGPGCTNAVTGIATAFRSESPVLHIGGQGAMTQHKMGSLQDLPHVELMTPITKFAATVSSTERVADMISMAAREAFNGATGPVYLEIPRDILDREVDITKAVIPQPGKYRASTRSIGDPRDIESPGQPVDRRGVEKHRIQRDIQHQHDQRPRQHCAWQVLLRHMHLADDVGRGIPPRKRIHHEHKPDREWRTGDVAEVGNIWRKRDRLRIAEGKA